MAGAGNRPTSLADRRGDLQNRLSDARQTSTTNRGDRQENRGDRQDNRQENRGDRQDNRTENRGDRQDYRDQRREDWQNHYDEHYGHHDDWHHGHWNGNYGDWWDHMWDDHTALMTLGVTRWGMNRIGYWMGYSGYSNPYYDSGAVASDPGYYADYSEPIVMDATTSAAYATYDASAPGAAALPPGVSQEAIDAFDQARAAFYEGKYPEALQFVDQALAKMPKDAVMHEFRALVLFAMGKYHDAAAVLNAVLAVGPGWDWTTMSSLYPEVSVYTNQLRALEKYVSQNPKAADGHFLAAYHYVTIGSNPPAIKELKKVTELQPNDTVAADMLRMLSPSEAPTSTPAVMAAAPEVPAESVVGTWVASGPKNTKYEMVLGGDGAFSWSYSRGTAPKQSVKGVYALDGNAMAIQPDGGGTMVMDLKLKAPDSLHADILGAAKGDPGLEFQKSGK